MTVVVLLGAPGAGKGTQAVAVASQLGLLHVATGDLFRAAVRDATPLGVRAKDFMATGQLVPDEITIEMLLERLGREDARAGVVLDGFPRTVGQANALAEALADRDVRVASAVLIEVPLDELVRRLSGRWICRAAGHVFNTAARPPRAEGICDTDGSELYQREDDQPDVIRVRLTGQLDALQAVVGYYRDAGLLHVIDGRRPIHDVTAALLATLPSELQRVDGAS